jgi:uncharacterized membrane protein YeaQ/YmgE (transglycosylase-associated protein family)
VRDELNDTRYRAHLVQCERQGMGIIGTIIVGGIIGALARFVMPGEQKMGWILTILLGIGGSVVAGLIGGALGWYQPGQGAGWIASVLGAVLLLFVVGKLRGGK